MTALRTLLGAAFGVALALVAPGAFADAPIPALQARVTDATGTLDATQRAALESNLAALEQRKGAQVAVLIVPTTQPETIEQYAVRAFEAWKLGRQKVDDGALLVVAKDDHRVRIEVGYGLEGAIPDVTAHRIIDEYLTPKFRAGDFYGGIADATGAMTKLIDGEALPPAYHDDRGNGGGDGFTLVLMAAIFLGSAIRMFTFIPLLIRAALVGGAVAVIGLFQHVGMPYLLFLALGGAVVTLFAGMNGGGRGWSSSGGSWGGSSGGGWGGGGGGGGFSGGGGSSGGGGASGSW